MEDWVLTANEIAYYKRIGGCEGVEDQYVQDMIPLLLGHVNEECSLQMFTPETLTTNVKLFLAQSLSFFSVMQPGLKSESVRNASFSYDFSEIPDVIKGLLKQYGYGTKRNYARFRAF